jgi:hypothetical protein
MAFVDPSVDVIGEYPSRHCCAHADALSDTAAGRSVRVGGAAIPLKSPTLARNRKWAGDVEVTITAFGNVAGPSPSISRSHGGRR